MPSLLSPQPNESSTFGVKEPTNSNEPSVLMSPQPTKRALTPATESLKISSSHPLTPPLSSSTEPPISGFVENHCIARANPSRDLGPSYTLPVEKGPKFYGENSGFDTGVCPSDSYLERGRWGVQFPTFSKGLEIETCNFKCGF